MGIARIETFMNRINTVDAGEVADICVRELDYLRREYTLSSFRSSLTKHRNAMREGITDPVKLKIGLDNTLLTREEIRELATRKNKQITADQKCLSPIYDMDAHVIRATKLLTADSYVSRILGLCALTGRRAAEIACTAEFALTSEGVDDYHVTFKGQLKVKGREDVRPYDIPVLHDPVELIRCLKTIRRDKPEFINAPVRFHDTASSEMSGRCKRLLSAVSDRKITTKDLRPIYAEIAFNNLDARCISKTRFFTEVLGHSEDDNTTALSYVDFEIYEEYY